ncbi:MAG: S-layer homology domain-containing protein [Bacillota bacterium]|nr:S-layer homology domain-containing protein [Bacillota bacterium]
MKKRTRIISAMLAILMIACLLPVSAFAEGAPEKGTQLMQSKSLLTETKSINDLIKGMDINSVINLVGSLDIPTYIVYCKMSNQLPAANAEITLTNQLNGETKSFKANSFGIALIPKSLLSVYTVAATCNGPLTGLKYSTVPGQDLSVSAIPELDVLVLYPVLTVGLNYTDHYSYMIGYNNGTVRPNGLITRGEAATMIFRLLDESTRSRIFTKSNSFSDVNGSCAHNNAISSLAAAGIIKGYNDGTFRPYQTVTREQFAAMIGRMFSVEYTGKNWFGDINGSFASGYINLLAFLGIMKGDGNGNVRPTANITRAEAATMLNRLLGRLPAADSSASCKGVKTWSDCPSTMWCYGDIMEATNSHNYTWALDTGNILNSDTMICEAWTSLRTDTPNWSALQK